MYAGAMQAAVLLLIVAAAGAAAAGDDEWAWAEENAGAAAARAMFAQEPSPLAPPASPGPFEPYVQRVLSAACCREGQRFNAATAACEAPPPTPLPPRPRPRPRPHNRPSTERRHPISNRGGLTSLPPNCPPGTKFDSETKECRDVWGAQ